MVLGTPSLSYKQVYPPFHQPHASELNKSLELRDGFALFLGQMVEGQMGGSFKQGKHQALSYE